MGIKLSFFFFLIIKGILLGQVKESFNNPILAGLVPV